MADTYQTNTSPTNADTTSNYRPDGSPSAVPAGSKRTGGNSQVDVYTAPDGTWYAVDKQSGGLAPWFPNGSTQAESGGTGTFDSLLGDIRGATDKLGITAPDPHNSPEFQQLMEAAKAFGGFYQQDRANADAARATDLQTIADLRAAAEGKTPSAAEALMRKNIDQNANQALGLAATLGGSNPGMALRAGLQSQSEMGAKSAADLAAVRAREQDAARAMLAEQTARGRAIDTANQGQTGNTFAGIVGAPYGATERAGAANQALAGQIIGAVGNAFGSSNGGYSGATGNNGNDAAAESDISVKKDVRPAPEMADAFLSSISPEERTRLQVAAKAREQGSPYVHVNDAADSFLSTLKPQAYKYKAPDGKNKKPGTRMGVMAQDLPAHDVVQGPDGKKWISADVIGDVLAGVGRLHDRVGQLERGNIDLTNRPHVKNKDGSTSTVRSMGVNIDGQEVLIPTVSDDGRIMTDDEAVAQYKRTGRHLGKFGSVADSNAYAKQLHEQQADMIRNQPMISREAVHDYLASLGITAP